MTRAHDPSIHASAVRVGDDAILIRGPSGSGKSRLAFDLITAGRTGRIPPAMLIGDDRILLAPKDGRLSARPAPELAGLIEIRGLGLRQCEFAAEAPVALVVDLAAEDAARMPDPDALHATIIGIKIPRIPVGAGYDPFPLVVAAVTTRPASLPDPRPSTDCPKQFGNHISPTIATD